MATGGMGGLLLIPIIFAFAVMVVLNITAIFLIRNKPIIVAVLMFITFLLLTNIALIYSSWLLSFAAACLLMGGIIALKKKSNRPLFYQNNQKPKTNQRAKITKYSK